MTTELAVHVFSDVRSVGLQLHVRPGPGAHCALFGWSVPPWHVDAGPPPTLSDAFACALVSCGTLAFLDAPRRGDRRSGWFTDAGDWWLPVQPSLGDRLRRRHPPWLRLTDSAERAYGLFDGSVSWAQQAQLGLILRRLCRPTFDRQLLWNLLTARGADLTTLQLPDDILALALPAVDGDYLEIVAREPATREAIHGAIATECARRGIPCTAGDAPAFSPV